MRIFKKCNKEDHHPGQTFLSFQTNLITKNKHVLHIRSLRLHLIPIFCPTICRAMLSFLILRLACLTLQIIHTNTTCSHYCMWWWDTSRYRSSLYGGAGVNDRHFYSDQIHNPSKLITLLCVGLDSHRCRVNLLLWHMWPPTAGVTYTYIEYSLCASVISAGGKEPKRPTVPLPFPAASGSQRMPRRWTGGCETLGAPCVFE